MKYPRRRDSSRTYGEARLILNNGLWIGPGTFLVSPNHIKSIVITAAQLVIYMFLELRKSRPTFAVEYSYFSVVARGHIKINTNTLPLSSIHTQL